jgi:hypothetical protein
MTNVVGSNVAPLPGWDRLDGTHLSIAAAPVASPSTCYLDSNGLLGLACDVVSGRFTLGRGVMDTAGAPGCLRLSG